MLQILPYVIILSSIWACIDERAISRRKRLPKGVGGNGPFTWAMGWILLWIVAFPLYLVRRGEALAGPDGGGPEQHGQGMGQGLRIVVGVVAGLVILALGAAGVSSIMRARIEEKNAAERIEQEKWERERAAMVLAEREAAELAASEERRAQRAEAERRYQAEVAEAQRIATEKAEAIAAQAAAAKPAPAPMRPYLAPAQRRPPSQNLAPLVIVNSTLEPGRQNFEMIDLMWTVTVRNPTNEQREFTAGVDLLDKTGYRIDRRSASGLVEPGGTQTVKGFSRLDQATSKRIVKTEAWAN